MALKISGTKLFIILFWTVEIILFTFWVVDQSNEHKIWLENYNKLSFNGVIADTVHYEMQHDLPTYNFTNGASHFSDMNEREIQLISRVGDSLSKLSGNDTVYVFRKNNSGNFAQIYPRK